VSHDAAVDEHGGRAFDQALDARVMERPPHHQQLATSSVAAPSSPRALSRCDDAFCTV